MKKSSILLLLLISAHWIPLAGQNPALDSLKQTLSSTSGKDRFEILSNIARMTSKTDPATSLGYAEEAVSIARDLDDPLILSNALNGLAISYYYLGDQQQSLNYLIQSIDQMKLACQADTSNLELLYRLAVFSNNAGNVYKVLGQLDRSLDVLLQAESYVERVMTKDPGNPRYMSFYVSCLNNKALLYQDLREIEKAEATLSEALTQSREMNSQQGIAMSLNNLGLIAIGKKAYDEALTIYTEALQINLQLKDSIAIAGTYNNIGLIYEETKAYSKALTYYQSSLLISERLNYLFGISNTYINMGEIYGILHQFGDAEEYLNRGLIAARRGNMLQLQQQSYHQMAEMYRVSKQYQKAFVAYQNFATIKDSIFNVERSKQIADMETKYETEKKIRENELLRKDITLKQTTQQLLILALSTLIIVIVLLIILARYKSRMLKQKTSLFDQEQKMHLLEITKKEVERKLFEDQVFAEQEINRLQRIKVDEQNRKLATSAIQVNMKNQILLSILRGIEQPMPDQEHNPGLRLKEISRLVRANLNLDRDWEQFKIHFEEVHPDFFSRLSERYPDLTSGEQKICAYYRINLGTNEIAQILNVTIGGVQKSRHRLRKKLGLVSETDMADFMMKF